MGLVAETLKSRIYCHRGLWTSVDQQNTSGAFEDAIRSGFGIETDVRDRLGSIVISHDPVISSFAELDKLPKTSTPIAFNIKADGLLEIDNAAFQEYLWNQGSFVFDGSIPEMRKYRERNLPHALRLSEHEREVAWLSQYIWLDAFESDWWIEEEVLKLFTEKHFVVVVSPELHGRPKSRVWEIVRDEMLNGNPNLGICTDHPDQFMELLK
jgi:glycerophosphoryl diester phosphodiesterase